MPRQVVNRTVTLVEVAKCGAVTVVVVDVTISSSVAVDLQSRVNSHREYTVFGEKP